MSGFSRLPRLHAAAAAGPRRSFRGQITPKPAASLPNSRFHRPLPDYHADSRITAARIRRTDAIICCRCSHAAAGVG